MSKSFNRYNKSISSGVLARSVFIGLAQTTRKAEINPPN